MLHVHRAERADRLVDGLAETLLAPLADPFAPDVVAVPTRGIERWLTQRLSTRLGTSGDRQDGVCANVEFPFPGRLIQGSARGGDRDRSGKRPVGGGTRGVAAARGRRRVPGRALACHACAAPRGRTRRSRGPDAPLRRGAPPRRPVRPLRRPPPGHGQGMGGRRERDRDALAARALAAPSRTGRRPQPG